jgi:hypothetical protein
MLSGRLPFPRIPDLFSVSPLIFASSVQYSSRSGGRYWLLMPLVFQPDEKGQRTCSLPKVQAPAALHQSRHQSSPAHDPHRPHPGALGHQLAGALHRQDHAPMALRALRLAQAGVHPPGSPFQTLHTRAHRPPPYRAPRCRPVLRAATLEARFRLASHTPARDSSSGRDRPPI